MTTARVHDLIDGVVPEEADEFYIVRSPYGEDDDRKLTWGELLAATGIRYDFENVGDWLYVETNGDPSGSPNGYGIEIIDTSNHGIFLHSDSNSGELVSGLIANPLGGVRGELDLYATDSVNNSSALVTLLTYATESAAGFIGPAVHIRASWSGESHPTDYTAIKLTSDLLLVTAPDGQVGLPSVDPGVAGALWNSAGVVHVSRLTVRFQALDGGGRLWSFTDESVPGPSGPLTAWAWTFGDGGTSSSQNPSHTYTNAGIYNVTLTVTGTSPDGSAVRSDFYVTVT